MAIDIATAQREISQIYIAAFGRVPDRTGLSYWVDIYATKGASLNAIAQGFTGTAEYAAKYAATQTNAQFVNSIYTNVFGRAAETAGSAFWSGKLADGSLTHGTLMNAMLNAASTNGSTDGIKLDNQTTYAVNAVLTFLDTNSATAQLATITSDTASVTTATAAAAAATAAIAAAAATEAATAASAAAATAASAAAAAAAASAAASAAATAAADHTAPTMSSAAVSADGQSIVVTYSELLSGTPEAGDYAVTLSAGSTTVNGATIGSGANANKVTLTLSNSINSGVTVSNLVYTATNGTANSIKDTATNPVNSAATQTLAAVTNSSAASNFTLTASAPIVTEIMVGSSITKAMTFALTLGSVPTEAVTINYATQTSGTAISGTDFTAATGTVTFAAGQTVAYVSIAVKDDATAETDETVAVLFSGTSLSGNVTGTGTILANDTTGNTVVLTAGLDNFTSTVTSFASLSTANDDTVNTDGPTQLTSIDTIATGNGTDMLSITPTTNTNFTLDDAIFTNVSGIEKIVILTTGTGSQIITTGAEFNGAFGTAGADLQTTSTTGAQTINMSAVTGPATLTSISDASIGGNFITMGAGITTVTATSTSGAMTINSAASAVATVTATSTSGAVSVTTGAGADVVTLTTADTSGNQIITGAGADTIIATAVSATTFGTTITGGTGADTITITGNTSKDTIVIGNTDSGITMATADSITGFVTADDSLKMGTAGTDGVNYVEATVAVANFAAALTAANAALNGTVLYSFQWDGTNGYLFEDTGVDGIADQVVVLVGITNAGIVFGDIIA